jgi:hypothetical protein
MSLTVSAKRDPAVTSFSSAPVEQWKRRNSRHRSPVPLVRATHAVRHTNSVTGTLCGQKRR